MYYPFKRTIKTTLRKNKLRNEIESEGWQFSRFRFDMIDREQADWSVNYLPIDVRDKAVLDAGAGEGETARFYLNHGAKAVYAIEPDKDAFKVLVENAHRREGLIPINESFTLKHLDLPVDFAKIDIEGYEELFLDFKPVKPMVVEVHGIPNQFRFEKLGYRMSHCLPDWVTWTCYAYWNC